MTTQEGRSHPTTAIDPVSTETDHDSDPVSTETDHDSDPVSTETDHDSDSASTETDHDSDSASTDTDSAGSASVPADGSAGADAPDSDPGAAAPAPVPDPSSGSPTSGLPDSGERSPEERRRRRKLIALVVLVALLLALALIIAWYLLTRKPLSSMPPLVKDKPHYAFSIYGVTAPLGVTTTADGERVYVTQSGGKREVLVFDRSGKKVGALAPPPNTGKIHVPVYVAIDPVTRSVYVSDRATATIYIYDSGGRYQGKVTPKGKDVGAWAPLGLAFDRAGKLYITDVGTPPHRLLVLARDGTVEQVVEPAAPGQLTFPNGVTVDGQGHIQVADSNNGRVVVFDQKGKVLANLSGSYGGVTLGLPRGLAVNDEKLYLVDTTNHQVRIFRLETSGDSVATYLGSFGEEGTADGFFEYPNGVACDSRARVYVTDRVNNRVQVWSY